MSYSFKAAAAAAVIGVAAFAAQDASASTISITGISGSWIVTDPGAPAVTGQGTDEIKWGDPAPPNTQQSGYKFAAQGVPFAAAKDTAFTLGTFTHFNFPVFAPSLESATLRVSFDFDVLDESNNVIATFTNITSDFDFLHWETTNNENPCADGGPNNVGVNINGCADQVKATTNPASSMAFTIGDEDFVFDVLGFKVGDDLLSEFWTAENKTNSAQLQARWTSTKNLAPIPLPAAGWLLLAGIGGLAAVGRRRKAT
ncbi:THxN family PEP-CTERM protein [Rhodovulum strictum]|uniref:THxN family PEP-CTERM protein n=1 Tax=Rhodovulum strictum TaxID=58314 RepID=UPI001B863C83|nr:THxN family PEP-CTERM protein [Rhodovulum strictum]